MKGIGIPVVAFALLVVASPAFGGGPLTVAGVSYFNRSSTGTPLTWAASNVTYYTDQGDLSPVLNQTAANSFVASALGQWTGVTTASLGATYGGSLAEDVNGTNVTTVNGLTLPADILPTATNKPIAVVYDQNGAVTEALLGIGASDPSFCLTNSTYGAPDAYTTDGHYAHALVVINGRCAATSASLADLKYHLVRTLGRALGLDWSQLNGNVLTGVPPPKAEDYSGFPLMHPLDPTCTVVTTCLRNSGVPNMDDRAALARLYPKTGSATGSLQGSVYFLDANGNKAQPMQGVNVIARWIDSTSGLPSSQYAASSISGFRFAGNVGNPISGDTDPSGNRYDQFGSNDTSLEGYFDLSGLEFPTGGTTATYQLSVEAINPLFTGTFGLGPYEFGQVAPAGTFVPINVTITSGKTTSQDILMQGSAPNATDLREPSSFDSPAVVPGSGDWTALLSGYGDTDFYSFSGHANNSLSVLVTALDANGNPTLDKTMPLIGIWDAGSVAGSPPPAFEGQPFNSAELGVTRLDALILGDSGFILGVADLRGDGRPDYRYRARIFYGDTVQPQRVSALGGSLLTIRGLGFREGTTVAMGAANAGMLTVHANQIAAIAPALPDGISDVSLTDPLTGAVSVISGGLTVGAAPDDVVLLLQGGNPATPVGGVSQNPFRVRVVQADGVTPVPGATVQLSASPATSSASVQFAACKGATTCSVPSDPNGEVSSVMTPTGIGTYTLNASLAPQVYSTPSFVQGTLSAISSSLDISLTNQLRWVAAGTTITVPLTARVLSSGKAVSGRKVSFSLSLGAGTLSAANVNTDVNGYSTSNLTLTALAAEVQVVACVDGKSPCQTFDLQASKANTLRLLTASGDGTAVLVGLPAPAVSFLVTDSQSPVDPVQGASVTVQTIVTRPLEPGQTQPVIVSATTQTLTSDVNGLVTMTPALTSGWGAVQVQVFAALASGNSAVATVLVLQ